MHVMIHQRNPFTDQITIDEHLATLDPDNPRDVIDYYLLEVEANKHDPESTFNPDRKFH